MEKILTADFSNGASQIRIRGLWQHDCGAKLKVKGIDYSNLIRVDFAGANDPKAYPVVAVQEADGTFTAKIPKEVTDQAYDINAYIYVSGNAMGYTVKEVVMPVRERVEADPASGGGTATDPYADAIEKMSEYAESAKTSAGNAAESAASAAQSEAAAAKSASTAASSAGNAESSATAAAKSAASTTQSEAAAVKSASAAASSAGNAESSATAAAKSAASATQSSSAATEAAKSAAASETAAAGSAKTAKEQADKIEASAKQIEKNKTNIETMLGFGFSVVDGALCQTYKK